MRRSNRLILLIGLFLAVVAFVGIFLLLNNNQPSTNGGGGNVTTQPTVFAATDIPLGVEVTADMLTLKKDQPVDQRDPTAFSDISLVVGQIARRDIATGAQLTAADFASSTGLTNIVVPPTLRAIAVQVDQVTGVGTVIQAGDYVDMIVGFSGDKFPVVTVTPSQTQNGQTTPETITPVQGVNATSVKVLIQGMQVLGVLLPPTATPQNGQPAPSAATQLTGQQEIVILGVTAQQAEVIKFAKMDGNIDLVLRSAKDFQDPNDPTIKVTPVPDVTTGIILKTLVDEYGVLVPQVVETILPQASPGG